MVLALIAAVRAEPPNLRVVPTGSHWVVLDPSDRELDTLQLARVLDDRKTQLRLEGDRRFAVIYAVGAGIAGSVCAWTAIRAGAHTLTAAPVRDDWAVDDPTRPGADSSVADWYRERAEWSQQQDNIAIVAGVGATLLLFTLPIPFLDEAPRRKDPWRVYDPAALADLTRPVEAPTAPPAPPAAPLPAHPVSRPRLPEAP